MIFHSQIFWQLFAMFILISNYCSSEEVTAVVNCDTTKGPIKIEVYESWAPLGAKRFLELVRDGFYTDIALYRCVKGFLTQFGISDNPSMKHWHREQIVDDPTLNKGIKKHYVSFAGGGANTRTTQIFIAFEDLDFLGKAPWETPFGMVVEGDSAVNGFYKGYGDIPPFGKGPDQTKIFNRGNSYVRENFPMIDFVKSCSVTSDKLLSEEAAKDITAVEPEHVHVDQPDLLLPPPEAAAKAVQDSVPDKLSQESQELESDREKVVSVVERKGLDEGREEAGLAVIRDAESVDGEEEEEEETPELEVKDGVTDGVTESSQEEVEMSLRGRRDRGVYLESMPTRKENVVMTALGLLVIALVVMYILTQYEDPNAISKSV